MSARVLLADDASFMRNMLRELLEAQGFEVVCEAKDGLEAIRFYRLHRPELVLMDTVMPRCSGIVAVKAIRTLDDHARIVMSSCRGQEALVMEALQAGALDYVLKPPLRQTFRTTLHRVFASDN